MVVGNGGPIPRAAAAPSASRRPAEPRTRLAVRDARRGQVAPVGFIATDSASLSSPLGDIVGRLVTAAPGAWSVSPLSVDAGGAGSAQQAVRVLATVKREA